MQRIARWMPRSLFGRMLLLQGLVVLAAVAAIALSLSILLQRTADEFVAGRLRQDAALVAQQVRDTPGGPVLAEQPRLGPLFDADGGSKGFAVFAADGRRIAGAGRAVHWPPAIVPAPGGAFAALKGRYVLALGRDPRLAGAVIVVEQDGAAPDVLIDDVVRAFLHRFVWLVVGIAFLTIAAGGLAVHVIVSQVERMARAAEAIGPGRIEARIDPANAPSELVPLVNSANRAFERLAAGYREQSEFIGNVSHELRTPLAVIALRCREISDPDLRATIERTVARASHVIGQLMELAGVECMAPVPTRFDLVALVRGVVEERSVLALEAGQEVAFEAGDAPVVVEGHAGLLASVVENLLGNAVQHNLPGTRIVIEVGQGASFAVSDDGQGIAESDRARLRRRHQTGTEPRGDGGGLGLAICERIVALHGGRIEIADARPAGTRVSVTLPSRGSELDADARHDPVRLYI